MTELGDLLGGMLKEQNSMKATQGIEPGTISSYFVFGSYRFKIRVTKILVEKQNIGGDSLIWGNSTFGTWGTHKWGGAANQSFILGNSLAAILGTSLLGSQSSAYTTVETILLTQTIPDIARYEIAKWIGNESANYPVQMALGTGSTAYSNVDTTLENEVARKTISYDISNNKKIEYQIEILSTDTSFHTDDGFREVGLFDATTSGNLHARGLISSLSLNAAENARITITQDLEDDSIGDATISTAGLNNMQLFLSGASPTSPSHMAWATGTSDINISDLVLEGEIERSAIQTRSRLNDEVSIIGILAKNQGVSSAITKSGLFDANTSGNMFAETKFGDIDKTSLFQIYETDKVIVV